MRLVIDIESDGLLDTASLIHCLCVTDLDTGELYHYERHNMEDGVTRLMEADMLIGHNIVNFDLPCIKKLYPRFKYQVEKLADTLILSRLLWPDMMDRDSIQNKIDLGLRGRHKLQAWGQRLDFPKGDYDGGWERFSQEMLDYCYQDVAVTMKLYELIQSKQQYPKASLLEHKTAAICQTMVANGFNFDVQKANQLTEVLLVRRLELTEQLNNTFKPMFLRDGPHDDISKRDTTPKKLYDVNGRPMWGKFAGGTYTNVSLTIFNPNSGAHVAEWLRRLYDWQPIDLTPTGLPKIDETVLAKLPWPEAQLLNQYMTVQKRLSQLAEGEKAWLKYEVDGKLHGDINPLGAVTRRATHYDPNIGQVPACDTLYGPECRELFGPSKGMVQVGIDVSGLELRMLAHYLAKYDDGAYGKIVCFGDIHTANMEAAGLTSRTNAKTFIYAFLYGAGDVKIGSIVLPLGTEDQQRSAGKKLKKLFKARVLGLNTLIDAVIVAAKWYKTVPSLDGAPLHCRSPHSALNTLLQSSGAIVCKQWMIEVDEEIQRRGWRNIAKLMGWIHDELQYEVVAEYAEEFGKLAVECITRSGSYLNVRVPLTGEYKIGNNWKECH